MSFTDLASLARDRQQQQQPPPQPYQAPQPQGDPAAGPPDPRSFTQSATNPASISNQVASLEAGGGIPAGLESNVDLGDVAKTKDKTPDPNADTADATYPPVVFAPSDYRRPAANRGPDEWGQTPNAVRMAQAYPGLAPGPDMPQPREAYGEIRDSGHLLAQYAAPGAGQLYSQGSFLASPFAAILDAISQGKFSRNYTAAALRGLEIRQREMILKSEAAMEQHNQYLTNFGTLLKIAEMDPSRRQEMERRVQDYIRVLQHPGLQAAYDARGLRGVAEWLNWEDAEMRRQLAATTQLRKVTDVDSEQREWDAMGGRSSGALSGGGALGIDPAQLPGRGGPEAPQTPTKEQSDPTLQANEYEKRIMQGLGRPPSESWGVLQEARRRMNGEPDLWEHKRGGAPDNAIGQVQAILGHNIDRIAAMPTPEGQNQEEFARQKLDDIRKNNPQTAEDIENLKNLRLDPASIQQAGGQRRHAITLAQQVYPGWNQGSYHQFHQVWNNANSRESQQLQAANRASTQMVILEAAINRLKIPEDSNIPTNVLNEWKTQGWTSDPQFAALNEPLRSFAQETIFMQTGRVNVTPVQQFLREAPLYGGKAQLRTLVRQAAIGGLHTMEQQIGVYHNQTGMSDTPPSMDQTALTIFSDFSRSNPNTGVFDKDALPELKSIETTPEQRARVPKWMTKEQQYEPMTKQQWEGLRATIEQMRKNNPNDPRLPQLLHEFGIRQ
jgi:hypothetical protein